MDNALEAACGIPKAFIEINTNRKANTPFIVISVINSSRINPFADSQGVLASHKPDKRGTALGLKASVKPSANIMGIYRCIIMMIR